MPGFGAIRYFLPFFGDKNLEVIRDSAIEEYWVWRMNNWKEKNRIRESEKKNLFTRSTPSNQTLRMEGQSLRQMYNWSQRMGYVIVVPLIKSPKPNRTKSHGTVYSNRRPNFTLDEWRKLTRFMRTWVGNEDSCSGRKGKPHKLHYSRNRSNTLPRGIKISVGYSDPVKGKEMTKLVGKNRLKKEDY
jgi:hypothetical protein